MTRKLTLTCVLSLIAHGSIIQTSVGVLVAFMFVLVYGLNKPWMHAGANNVTLAFQISVFLFFLMALILKAKAVNNTTSLNYMTLGEIRFPCADSFPVPPRPRIVLAVSRRGPRAPRASRVPTVKHELNDLHP